ncbi:DnaJ family domain-containing protein [Nocardia africana]
MTERKPAGMGFESWIDKQIREATERGEFDNLAGTGKPLPGMGEPYDENWWLNNYLRREGVGGEALLPTSLVLRRDLERLPERVAEMDSEAEVRAYVSDLNARVVEWIRLPHGPHVRLAPARADEVVARWRADRRTRQRRASAPGGGKGSPASTSTRYRDSGPRWWRRLIRRDRPGST